MTQKIHFESQIFNEAAKLCKHLMILIIANFVRSFEQKGRQCVASNPQDFREEGEEEEIINLDIFLLNTNGILMVETIIGPLRLHPEQKSRGIMLQIMHSVSYFLFL